MKNYIEKVNNDIKIIDSDIIKSISKLLKQRIKLENELEYKLINYMNNCVNEFVKTDSHFNQKKEYCYCDEECTCHDIKWFEYDDGDVGAYCNACNFITHIGSYEDYNRISSNECASLGNQNYLIEKLFDKNDILKKYYSTKYITNSKIQKSRYTYSRNNIIPKIYKNIKKIIDNKKTKSLDKRINKFKNKIITKIQKNRLHKMYNPINGIKFKESLEKWKMSSN